MKKAAAVFLALALVFSLSACGKMIPEDLAPKGDASNIKAQLLYKAAPEKASAFLSQKASSPASMLRDESASAKEPSFSEVVAVDNDKCLIKITGIDPDSTWGYTLKTELENRSSDKTYMFCVKSASINGVQTEPLSATEVAAGKKANDEINFLSQDLEENDIGDYTDIEMTFRVYDSEDWSADDIAEETVHVYPYGKENASKFVREPQATDQILVDNDTLTVVLTGYSQDDIWGYSANLFLQNKSDKNLMISVDDCSVNDIMCDPYYAATLAPGKCCFSSITWSNNTLEENGISSIENIEFELSVTDYDDWFADPYCEEKITLTPDFS